MRGLGSRRSGRGRSQQDRSERLRSVRRHPGARAAALGSINRVCAGLLRVLRFRLVGCPSNGNPFRRWRLGGASRLRILADLGGRRAWVPSSEIGWRTNWRFGSKNASPDCHPFAAIPRSCVAAWIFSDAGDCQLFSLAAFSVPCAPPCP